MSRAQARAAGLTRYFNGKFCPQGHLSERHVSSGGCIECLDERAQYRDRTTDKERASNRIRNERYREANHDDIALRHKSWRMRNRHTIAAQTANVRAKRFDTPGTLTAEDVRLIFRNQHGACAECHEKLIAYILDHITALGLGGSNYPTNIQLLCPKCDKIKSVADRKIIARARRTHHAS